MSKDIVSKKIMDEGAYFIPKFIDKKEVQKIYSMIININNKKGKGEGTTFFNGKRVLLNHLTKFNLNIFYESLKLIYSSVNRKFDKIAKEILEESYLRRIDSYISPIDNKPVIDWHNDTSYSGAALPKKKLHHPNFFKLRFFLYLTDVEHNNGSLACIKGSHKLVSAVTKIFYEKIFDYEPYWDLNSFRKLIQKENFKNEIINIVGYESYNNFLENSKFNYTEKDTDLYDFEAKAGGLVIFDDRVFHRGSSCLKTDRTVMRFIYASNNF